MTEKVTDGQMLNVCRAAWSVIWFRVLLPGTQRTEAKQAPVMKPHGQPNGSVIDPVQDGKCLKYGLNPRVLALVLGLGPWTARCSFTPENSESGLPCA